MGDLTSNFSRSEFECKCGCGFDTVDFVLLTLLEDVRDNFDSPVSISSGCRCLRHNTLVGGSPSSQHLYGRAADFTVYGVQPSEVQAYLMLRYPESYGIGSYGTFTHFDSRSGAAGRW